MEKKIENILVCGAGGFIAGFLVRDLLDKGFNIIAADIKPKDKWYQFFEDAENHTNCNLQLKENCYRLTKNIDRIYNLACNMGGMGFIESNQALCIENVLIQTHIMKAAVENKVGGVLYSSSACVYPTTLGSEIKDSTSQSLKEDDVFPALPNEAYGWEKLFSEFTTNHFGKDYGIDTRVCRYHTVYGPHGTWRGGKEKVPAAICRKVAEAKISSKHEIEIWGDGKQTRSFMYVDDCVKGMDKIWEYGNADPINLGSDVMISINDLVTLVEDIAGVKLKRKYNLDAPQGVRGRNSDNTKIKKLTGWSPSIPVEVGIEKTYSWIYDQIKTGANNGY